jgi:hypothetical protein
MNGDESIRLILFENTSFPFLFKKIFIERMEEEEEEEEMSTKQVHDTIVWRLQWLVSLDSSIVDFPEFEHEWFPID